MKKIILFLTFCFILPLMFSGCGTNEETPNCIDERLIGCWEVDYTQVMYEEADVPGVDVAMAPQLVLMFFENGKYVAATASTYAYKDQRAGEWYTDNNGLLVLENYSFSYGTGLPNVLKYSFKDDNTLVINSFDGSYSLTRSSEPFSKIPH